MCPSFMVTREERHSTRGRARLLQVRARAGPVASLVTFDASPGHVIPGRVGRAVSGIAGRLRERAEKEHPK